jgi:hypothetical protein
MSLSPICVKSLLASRGIPNYCSCPWCREEKEHEEALDYYRKDRPAPELFPEKTGKEEGENG